MGQKKNVNFIVSRYYNSYPQVGQTTGRRGAPSENTRVSLEK
jgi:hypothetical protein